MLAYAHFRLGEYAEAEAIARDLYDDHKFRTLGDLEVENHALVLLRALTKQQEALDKVREAYTLVWEPLCIGRVTELTSTPERKALLQRHISAGNALATRTCERKPGRWLYVLGLFDGTSEILEPLCE